MIPVAGKRPRFWPHRTRRVLAVAVQEQDPAFNMALAAQPDLSARLRTDEHDLRARLEQRETLLAVIRGTHETLDPAAVASFLVEWAPAWIPAAGWAVVGTERGRPGPVLATRSLSAEGESLAVVVATVVASSAEDFYAADVRRDPRLSVDVTGAVAAYALLARGEIVGTLVGFDPAPAASEPRLGALADAAWHTLLEPAAIALDNAVRLRRAEELSVTDDLTRLYNCRYLHEALRREGKRAVRSGKPLSVLFIDLDGFKAVNDTHDHLHGSRALTEAALLMRGCARETDIVARFGGDEFAVVLPDTDAKGALAVAHRIRERIAAHRFLASEGHDIRLTVSVGVATLSGAGSVPHDVLVAADQAMYRVKASGKNGVQVAAAPSAG